jgi:hypothetical protein
MEARGKEKSKKQGHESKRRTTRNVEEDRHKGREEEIGKSDGGVNGSK